jgi:hypothetical protein
MLEGLKEDAGHFRTGQVGVMAGAVVMHMALQQQREAIQDNAQDSVQDNPNAAKLLAVLGERTLSASEMRQRMGMKNRANFMKNWLQPALELGVIERTVADKPKSRKQKYRKHRSLNPWFAL